MNAKHHWEHVYTTKRPHEVSWFQNKASVSLSLIARVAQDPRTVILDVGGGASTLVDGLLEAGYQNVTVLDISSAGMAQAQTRLGTPADNVRWREADILRCDLAEASVDLWHDRAVFHFFTAADDRARYAGQVRRALRPGGHLVIATFAEDGPRRCSGLDVARHGEWSLQKEFGDDFELLSKQREDHVTPDGAHQAFLYCLFRYAPRKPKT